MIKTMIKIALELPEFEKELNISVTLKKDGEVITTSSSSPEVKAEVSEEVWKQAPETIVSSGWKQELEEEKVTPSPKKTRSKKSGGNMMDISF